MYVTNMSKQNMSKFTYIYEFNDHDAFSQVFIIFSTRTCKQEKKKI